MHGPSMSSPATPLTPHGFVLFHEVGQGGSLSLGGQGKEEQAVRLVGPEHQGPGAAGDRSTRDKLNWKPWAWVSRRKDRQDAQDPGGSPANEGRCWEPFPGGSLSSPDLGLLSGAMWRPELHPTPCPKPPSPLTASPSITFGAKEL